MADELDDKLRDAMKTLDEQVPSGYFDALPNQILTRLSAEDGSDMQHGTGTTPPARDTAPDLAPPPMAASRPGLARSFE